MFDQDEERFATLGLAAKLPSAVIDGIWDIIDQNLKGGRSPATGPAICPDRT